MNCRPGDLVILLRCNNPYLKKYIGSIRTVKKACTVHDCSWDLEPAVHDDFGYEASWHDDDMRPIRGQDGEDEMLRIAGYPHKETA